MAVFAYTVVDAGGHESAGTLLADTPLEGRQRLRDRGLQIMNFATAIPKRSWLITHMPHRRRKDQVAETARYLSLLLGAGAPLAETLDVLTHKRKGQLPTVLVHVRDRVVGGSSLSEALAEHPQWFDRVFVAAVRVGELTGNLDETLTHLAEHLRAQQSLRQRLTGALTYPAILTVVGIGVVIFLTSFVVPQLLGVLTAAGRPLPASTMLLKSASDLLVNHWLLLAIAAALASIATVTFYQSDRGRLVTDSALLRVPVLGPLIQKSVVAQFAQQMTVQLRTGIPFVEAVAAVAALSRNRILVDELGEVRTAVEAGSDIATTLEDSRIFPPVVTHLMAVGQRSGELTEMLEALRDRFEGEVAIAITRFTAALEPALIVVLAGAVGFVVFACLMPMLEATRAVGM